MTTTDLYSGYTADGKPSSRILRPPGGASSNIFGGPEPAAPAPRQQVQQEMAQQSPVAHYQPPAAQNPTADAKNEYQKNKPQGKGEAPFALFAESGKTSTPSQFDNCNPESQTTGAFNPITHEETQGSSPCKDFDARKVHPQQVVRNQQNQEQPARMVRGQGNYNAGKVQYNPITGEEYPSDYGQQKGENEEEQEKDENDETENDKNESTDSPNDENNTSEEKKPEPVPAPAVQTPPAPFQKVRQPPGGKSSGLW